MKRSVLPILAVLGLVWAAFACASASAKTTVLCKAEESPCKPANVYPEGTAFKAVNEGTGEGQIRIAMSYGTIRCRSVIEGTVGKAASGKNLSLSVSKWSLGNWPEGGEPELCSGELVSKGENCGANEALSPPYSAVVTGAGYGGDFAVEGPSWQIKCYIGSSPTLNCTYAGESDLTSVGLGEGLHGKLAENDTMLQFTGENNPLGQSGAACLGAEPHLSGTYEIVEPNGQMYVTWLAAAPIATTESATNVKASSATLNGKVNPEGSSTSYWFEYDKTEYKEGETTSHGTKIPLSPESVGSGTANVSVKQTPTGLSENTTYHFRVVAENEAKEKGYGTDKTFKTLKVPKATTEAASSVKASSATLNGKVNPESSSTSYWFEYDKTEYKEGETTSHGTKIPLSPESVGSGTANVSVKQTPTGLSENTTYHFRVVAESQAGNGYGKDKTFKTLKVPKATTEAADEIGTSSVRLNGTVNPEGSATTYWFEYDKTEYKKGEGAHGTKIPVPAKSLGSGTSNVAVHQTPNGLSRGQTYHYRVVASGAGATVNGEDITFTTMAEGPTATTGAATHKIGGGATLNATVNPEGSETNYRFEWATDNEYAATSGEYGSATGGESIGSGEEDVEVSDGIEGLEPGAFYHFRVIAESPAGTTYGADKSFIMPHLATFCEVNPVPLEYNVCPEESTYPAETTIIAELPEQTLFVGGSTEIDCSSELIASSEAESGAPLPIRLEGLSFDCTGGFGGSCQVTSELESEVGYVAWAPGSSGGWLEYGDYAEANSVIHIYCSGYVNCRYHLPGLSLKGGNPAQLNAGEKALTKVSGSLCPSTMTLKSATYTVSEPEPLYVAQAVG